MERDVRRFQRNYRQAKNDHKKIFCRIKSHSSKRLNPTQKLRHVLKLPSKIVDSEEFRIERAIDLKTRRAGHLRDIRKKLNSVKILSLTTRMLKKYFKVYMITNMLFTNLSILLKIICDLKMMKKR